MEWDITRIGLRGLYFYVFLAPHIFEKVDDMDQSSPNIVKSSCFKRLRMPDKDFRTLCVLSSCFDGFVNFDL